MGEAPPARGRGLLVGEAHEARAIANYLLGYLERAEERRVNVDPADVLDAVHEFVRLGRKR